MPYSDTDKIKLPIIHIISISILFGFQYTMNMISIMLILFFLDAKLVLYEIVIKVFMYLNYN